MGTKRISDLGRRPDGWNCHDWDGIGDWRDDERRCQEWQARWDAAYASALAALSPWKRVLHRLGFDVALPPTWTDTRWDRSAARGERPEAPPHGRSAVDWASLHPLLAPSGRQTPSASTDPR